MTGIAQTDTPYLMDLPILQEGGYKLIGNLASPSFVMGLCQEAQSQFAFAQRNIAKTLHPMPERGGQPARQLYSAPGGKMLHTFYHHPAVLQCLERSIGVSLMPTGEHGTYSYYLESGDFLSLHRDIDECDVTLITTLEDKTMPHSKSGMLCLYPGRTSESLANIRKSPLEGAQLLRLPPGESLILLGGIVPHWVLPMKHGESRTTALLCYKMV